MDMDMTHETSLDKHWRSTKTLAISGHVRTAVLNRFKYYFSYQKAFL